MTHKPSKELLRHDLLEILRAHDLKNYTKRKARFELEARYGRLSSEMREFVKLETSRYVETMVSKVRRNMTVSSSASGQCSPARAKSPEVVNQQTSPEWESRLVLDRPPSVVYSNTEILDEPREEWEEPAEEASLLPVDLKRNRRKAEEAWQSHSRSVDSQAETNSLFSRRKYRCSNNSCNPSSRRLRSERKSHSQRPTSSSTKQETRRGYSWQNKNINSRNKRVKLKLRTYGNKSRSWSRSIVSRSSSSKHSRYKWETRRAWSQRPMTREASSSTRRRQSYPGADSGDVPQIKFEITRAKLDLPMNTSWDSRMPQPQIETPNYQTTAEGVRRNFNREAITFDVSSKQQTRKTLTPVLNRRRPRTPIKFGDYKAAVETEAVLVTWSDSTNRTKINSQESSRSALHSAESSERRGRKRLSDASSKWPPKKLRKAAGTRRERETDPNRIAQRLKQVDKGKNSRAYRAYRAAVPKSSRRGRDEHPRTPNVLEKVSNRRWKGKCNKWRRLVHKWEAENLLSEEGAKTESDEGSDDIGIAFEEGLENKSVEHEDDVSSVPSIKYSDESSKESEEKNLDGQSPVAPDFDLDPL